MTKRFPPAPELNDPLAAARPSTEARRLLALRRSANKHFISEPGPSSEELDELLAVAARVPDHRKLGPWRFVVFEGGARREFGAALSGMLRQRNAPEEEAVAAQSALERAPTVVAVVSSPVNDGRTPIWEQELSAGAVCYNLLLAANAAGWAGVWLTEWMAFDAGAGQLLGLAESERIAGFVYIGTATMESPERARADVSARITRWQP